MGRSGLVRDRSDRKIAGVCAALGRASATDPLLWRALLAVLVVFSGIGLLLYALAWLCFPQRGDEVSALESLLGRGRSSTSLAATLTLAGTVAFLGVVVCLDPSNYPMLVLGVATPAAAVAAGRRSAPDETDAPAAPEPVVAATEEGYRSPFAPGGPYARTREFPAVEPETPSVTAPVEPVPPAPPVRRRYSHRLTVIGGAVTALAMAVMSIVAMAGVPVPAGAFGGVALLLIGMVLIVATWWGRSRSLIVVGAALSAVLAVQYFDTNDRPAGPVNERMAPVSVEEIPPQWSVWFGESELDLRGIDFTESDEVRLQVMVRGAAAEIHVPPDVDVVLFVDMTGGNAEIHDPASDVTMETAGSGQLVSEGADGPGGGRVTIDVTIEFGTLEVTR
ncbi:phage shock protein C (PspC) family protein [Stackebrandtia albiflava]|uniref:Phage shock protein C (PspC) family protein n=2 Tax=Stackebrandtia albiflava TaxID=406432 RepID=A0A562V1J5_9ACTN|nr:phage shock protein C (PspC) family protein [Stackebrandtia albiflava]